MAMITALYLGDRSLGVASARPSAKGVELTRAEAAALPDGFAGLEGETKVQALQEALARLGGDIKEVVLVVPRSQAILRNFSLPQGTPEELDRMVRYQLEKDLPVPIEQVRYSYAATPAADGKVRVMAAAVPTEAMDRLKEPLERAGVAVQGAVVSSFGLAQLVPAAARDEGSLVLAVAGDEAEIVVVSAGVPSLCRQAPLREGGADVVATEVTRAMLSYAARSASERAAEAAGTSPEVRRVLVAGEGESVERLAAELRPRLSAEVELLAVNGTIQKPAGVRIPPEGAAAAGVCVGLLRRGEREDGTSAPMPDVLHPPSVRRRLRLTRRHVLAGAAVLLLSVLIAATQITLASRRAELAALEGERKAIEPKAERVLRLEDQLKTARRWSDERFSWILLFEELRRGFDPRSMYLTSVSADGNGVMRVAGRARDGRTVNAYVTELQKMADVFSEVASEGITEKSDGGEYRTEFALRLKIAALAPPDAKARRADARR